MLLKEGLSMRINGSIHIIESIDKNNKCVLLSNTETNTLNWVYINDLKETYKKLKFNSILNESKNKSKVVYQSPYMRIIINENKNSNTKISIQTKNEIFSKIYNYNASRSLYEFTKFFESENDITPARLVENKFNVKLLNYNINNFKNYYTYIPDKIFESVSNLNINKKYHNWIYARLNSLYKNKINASIPSNLIENINIYNKNKNLINIPIKNIKSFNDLDVVIKNYK